MIIYHVIRKIERALCSFSLCCTFVITYELNFKKSKIKKKIEG